MEQKAMDLDWRDYDILEELRGYRRDLWKQEKLKELSLIDDLQTSTKTANSNSNSKSKK